MNELNRNEKREEIVQKLLSEHTFIALPNKELYVYQDGIYLADGTAENIIVEAIEEGFEEEASRYDKLEAIDTIKCRNFVGWDFFNENMKEYTCLRNGVLNLENKILVEHSPQYHFLNKLPVQYVLEAECSLIEKFLREITSSEEAVQSIYEFFGYCLYRDMPIHKSFMLVGEGANGKSTLLGLLKAFLGEQNVSNLSLQQLCGSRFSIANLHGKLANIFGDLEDKSLYATGQFKMLTGNDTIDAERKFIQRRLKMTNYAKMIFSCNKVPINENDDTDAFWRRWIVLTFPNIFKGERADKHILEQLTVPEELSGLLNKALEGLRRLLERGHFTVDPSSEELREDWIMASDSVLAFKEKCLVENPTSYEQRTVVYQRFIEFCKEHNLPTLDNNIFSRKLRRHIKFRDCQKTIDGHRGIWCYGGIKLKRPDDEQTTLGVVEGGENESGSYV